MIWSVDAELDEVVADAKVALTTCGDQGAAATNNVSNLFSKARKAKQNAENDKETVQLIVKKFLVRQLLSFTLIHFELCIFRISV